MKNLPNNIDAEKHIIASLLIDSTCIKLYSESLISYQDFFLEKHRKIMFCIEELIEQQKPIDIIILTEILTAKNYIEKVSTDYISELIESIPTSANIEYYFDIIREKAAERETLTIANAMISDIHNGNNIYEVLRHTEKVIFDIQQKKYNELKIENAYDICESNLENGIVTSCISSTHNGLDWILGGGFIKQDLVYIAGRTSTGKTTFICDMIYKMKNKIKIGVISSEMPSKRIVNKLLSCGTGIDSKRLEKVNRNNYMDLLSPEEIKVIRQKKEELKNCIIKINDIPNIRIDKLLSVGRKMKKEYDIDILFYDYLQLTTPDNNINKSAPKHEKVDYFSKSLKGLARELDIPLIALAQLNRNLEKRNSEPLLSDLKDSGAIEQDGDVIIFLHKTKNYGNIESEIEVIVGKGRNCGTGRIKTTYKKTYNRFQEKSKDMV